MLEPLIPDGEQAAAIWRMAYEPTNAALNTSELGVGKTLVAVETAKTREAKTQLIIAPLGTAPGWNRHIQTQNVNLPFNWIKNDKNRDTYLKQLKSGSPGVFFIGIQYFVSLGWIRKPVLDKRGDQRRTAKGKLMWKDDRTSLWRSVYPDFIVLDETHKGANKGTKTFKTLNMQTGDNHLNGAFKLAQSATPYGNKFENAWSIPRWLWPDDDIVPRSYPLWRGRWAETEYDPFSYDHVKVLGEKPPAGAWYDSLPCHIHIEAKPIEYVEFDPVTREPETIYVIRDERLIELTPKQRRIYDEIENQHLAWLGENPLVVELPVTELIRQNQIALAEPIIAEDGTVTFAENAKSSTMDEIVTIINEIDEESAVIFSASQKFNENVVLPRLRKLGYTAEAYDGKNLKTRDAARERFERGETKYLAVVIEAGGTGLDGFQHATRNVIWASRSLNGVSNEQASGRVPRRGQTQTVREFFITRIDTRDEESYSSLAKREIERRKSLKGVK